ncbi:MAG: AAA family ATPase [Thermodesulfobacteriota bacterium]
MKRIERKWEKSKPCTQGKDFLGISFSKKLKVLYADVETPKWKRPGKLKAICDEELPEHFYFLDSVDLKEDFPNLLALCSRERYDVLVFDTQNRIFSVEQENDNAEANYFMSLSRKLTSQTNCAIVLVHHMTKTDDFKGVYRGRGASAIAGAVDVVVNLEALDQEIIRLSIAKNRIVGINPDLYLRKAGEDRFEPYTPPEGSSGFEIFRVQDFILSLSPEKLWHTIEIYELGKAQGFSEVTPKRALSRLVQAGKVTRTKRGIYQILALGQWVTKFSAIPDPNDPNVVEADFPDYL